MSAVSAVNKGKYLRRKAVSTIMSVVTGLAGAVGLFFLACILFTLIQKGFGGLSLSVFTEPMRTPGQNGGLANAIVGSLIQVGLGALLGAPLGMAVGVYLSEVGRDRPFASLVRFVNDILLSAPSVLVGLFVYQILVRPMHSYSAIAGGVALALLAMPVIARTTEDIMKLVPDGYRDGSRALGARDSVTIGQVMLPAAFGGIMTGILLAVSRIAGETAPLLFTSFGSNFWTNSLVAPMASLPTTIYRYAQSPFEELVKLAWAGALIITFGVLVLNVGSRLLHRAAGGGGR